MEADNRPELRRGEEGGIKAQREDQKILELIVKIEETDEGDQFELMNTKL